MLIAMSAVAYADEVNSPSVSFITTANEDGTYTVTLNWDKTALQAFEYAVVYDEEKVSVTSAKLTGEFLSKYLGDGKNYSGIAIANDNGGYVALGGVVEAQDPTKIPEYEGAIARLIFTPKESQKDASDAQNTTSPEGSDAVPDMGDIKVVNGVSGYASSEEIKQKADTDAVATFDLSQAVDGNPVVADTTTSEETTAVKPQATVAPSTSTSTAEAVSTEETASGTAALEEQDASGEAAERVSGDAVDASSKSTKISEKKKASKSNAASVLLIVAGCAVIAVVLVIYYKKRGVHTQELQEGKSEDSVTPLADTEKSEHKKE